MLETLAEGSPDGNEILQSSDEEIDDLDEPTAGSHRIKEIWKKMKVESEDAKVSVRPVAMLLRFSHLIF